MDDKRKVQNLLNQSLSGLKENPFLARRVIAKAKGEEPVAKRISTAMVIVLVLVILTITAAAAALIWREAGEKIAVMQRDNGYYDTWDTDTKVELVRYLAELGELKDNPNAERLLGNSELTDAEKNALCDRIVTEYMGDPNVEMVTLENLLSAMKGEGYMYTWSVEDQYWYQELLRKNGMLGYDVPHLVLPEEGEITQEEAIRIARELLEKVSDWDLDNGERTQTLEEKSLKRRVWTIWYDLMTDGEYKGAYSYVELSPDGSIIAYDIPELNGFCMKGIIPDDTAIPEEQTIAIGKKTIAETLGIPESELPEIRAYYTKSIGNMTRVKAPYGQPVWTIWCAEKNTCAVLSPDGTQLLYAGMP